MNFAANLHPTAEHVGAAGAAVPSSHKLTVSHAIIFAFCMMDSGVFISPASGATSNKQYARFFIPTSMLNTLAVVAVVVVAVVANGCSMQYIPSHEAIAGDGIDLFCSFLQFRVFMHAMCLCVLQREK
jgi:hypothetical protein